MKITVEYQYRIDALIALHAKELYSCIDDLDEYLRDKINHGEISDDVREALQKVRDILHENKPTFGITE